MARTIAIGDIHGCSTALETLLDAIAVQPTDTIITLGDYCDRGSSTKSVFDQLIALSRRCNLVPLLGNHDQLMLAAVERRIEIEEWLAIGGQEALDSYGQSCGIGSIPEDHVEFLRDCRLYFETERHFFVHASYRPQLPLDQQDKVALLWLSLLDYIPGPHCSGKIAVVGHTPQKAMLKLGHLIDIDTGCCFGGLLTALDVESGQVWQVGEGRWQQ
jgi:serine/threonine protein phosphatase 1